MSIAGACRATLLVTINNQARMVELTFDGTHSHSIEESDIKKTSDAVKAAVISHLSFGYKSCQVNTVLKKEFTQTGCGVEYLKLQNVGNLRRKVIDAEGTNTSKGLEKDISDVIDYLHSEKKSENPSIFKLFVEPETLEKILLFTTQWQIESLQKYGHLVFIDSTDNINYSKWKLTTIYFQNHVGVWAPGAQMLMSVENSNLISVGLELLKNFCQGDGKSWNPYYFIIGNEAKGIFDAFPGLSAGENIVRIYFCKVHLKRTLMRHLGKEKNCYNLKLKAMNKITKIGCEATLEEALKACSNSSTKEYLIKNWKRDTAKWGMYARQHSPLLLQNLTTNPVESYHCHIKRDCKSTDSFKGNYYDFRKKELLLNLKIFCSRKFLKLKVENFTIEIVILKNARNMQF